MDIKDIDKQVRDLYFEIKGLMNKVEYLKKDLKKKEKEKEIEFVVGDEYYFDECGERTFVFLCKQYKTDKYFFMRNEGLCLWLHRNFTEDEMKDHMKIKGFIHTGRKLEDLIKVRI
jgi:hypothetical protein